MKTAPSAPRDATLAQVFGADAVPFLQIADTVISKASRHSYHFMADDAFRELMDRNPVPVGFVNQVLAHETLEKSHLCAVTLICRNRSWIDATVREFESGNYFGFAAAARGYIESVADGVDGLSMIGASLAEHHRSIERLLTGTVNDAVANFGEFEEKLDHYMFAGWSRNKDKVRKAKETQTYVEGIQSADVPDLISHWRKLCSIAHPSSTSVQPYHEFDEVTGAFRFIDNAEKIACDKLLAEIHASLAGIMSYAMNPSLIVLKVMHKFPRYPRIEEMKKMAFDRLPIWAAISKHL